jgi:protein gp37
MSDKTGIEWSEATWNPIAGCTVLSPGCTNCYAMREAGGRLRSSAKFAGLTQPSKAGPVWTGEVRLWEPAFKADFLYSPRPRRVFVNSMSDLFHESVPDEWIDRVFATMARCPQHTFQVLTKRAERMRDYCKSLGRHHTEDRVSLALKAMAKRGEIPADSVCWYTLGDNGWHFKNVWLGVSAEDRERCQRIAPLRETPTAVRFLSLEPLLEDLGQIELDGIGWVIVGGESGPGARPMYPDWARSLRDQCIAAGVPFFFKQWGEFAPVGYPDGVDDPTEHLWIRVGKKAAGRELDGRTWDEYPREERER